MAILSIGAYIVGGAASTLLFSYGFYALLEIYLVEPYRSLTRFQVFAACSLAPLWVVIFCVFGLSLLAGIIDIGLIAFSWLMRPVWLWLTPRGAYRSFWNLAMTMWRDGKL